MRSFRNITLPNIENVLVIVLALLIILAWWTRGPVGFESSASQIQHALGAAYTTEHFTIFYSPASFSEDEIRRVGAEHEFRFQQVAQTLQIHLPGRIASYIYPGAEIKRKYIGTGTTNIAKPWRKEIHLTKDSWEGTLKHELVHVLAGEFGMPIIKAHYHTGLVEGLATAIDGDYGNRTLHEYAAAMLNFGIVKNPEHLISPLGFALEASSVSYVLMGSFCRFLLDRYGMMRFKELYGGKSAEDVYGKSYEQLIEDWQHFLRRVEVPEQWRSHVEFYFKRPSIFAKECARAVAKLNQQGWNSLAENASVEAMRIFSRSLHASWNTEAFSGLVRSAYQAAQYDTVIQLLDRQWRDSVHQTALVNQLLLYGDALWHNDNVIPAHDAFTKILMLNLSDRHNEAAAMRLEAMSKTDVQIRISDFFIGSMKDTAALILLDNLIQQSNEPLFHYLKAKIYFRHGVYQQVQHELDNVQQPFDMNILEFAKEQLLGETYFRLGKYETARFHFWQSLNFNTNEASMQKVNDWLERCEWFEENAAHYIKQQ